MKQHSILGLLVLALAAAGTARADGMMIAPYPYDIYETGQTAYLEYDAESGDETLHILPSFRSNVEDFAWIIPLPSLPELDESDAEFFRELESLSATIYRYRDEAWGCNSVDYIDAPAEGNDGVDIVEEQLVGVYRSMIVSADDAGELGDSLVAWNFLHEGNEEEVEALLQSYVDEGWYFVTLKVDSAAIDMDPEDWYWYGAMHPIRMRFAAEAPVYPMRISALSADEDTPVTLYVKAEGRMEFDGARCAYANRLSASELAAMQVRYPRVASRLREGDFLTKLTRRYSPDQMDADIYPQPAADDEEFHSIRYSGIPLGTGLLLATALSLFMRTRRPRPAFEK